VVAVLVVAALRLSRFAALAVAVHVAAALRLSRPAFLPPLVLKPPLVMKRQVRL
jgi:hypothetical protein